MGAGARDCRCDRADGREWVGQPETRFVSRERGWVVGARGKEAVAKIVPVAPKPKRKFGRLKGKGSVGPEFFEPLPEEELKLWE